MHKVIHEFVKRERAEGKVYHYREPEKHSFIRRNKGKYSYFFILLEIQLWIST